MEELWLVELEIGWTVNWFQWKKDQWTKQLNDLNDGERPPGLDCYCHKQVTLWDSLADSVSMAWLGSCELPELCHNEAELSRPGQLDYRWLGSCRRRLGNGCEWLKS